MQKPRPSKAILVSSTSHPLETLWLVWMQSREDRHNWPTPKNISWLRSAYVCIFMMEGQERIDTVYCLQEILTTLGYKADGVELTELLDMCTEFDRKFNDTISMLLNENVPVTEHISFTFLLQNIPITVREQLVRHRIGTHLDAKVGVDIIPLFEGYADLPAGAVSRIEVMPELAQSSFWSQTARVVPWDNFYTDGRYILPDSADDTLTYLEDKLPDINDNFKKSRMEVYTQTLRTIEEAYTALIKSGMPLEDARNLIPLGATHSITWTLNLKAMSHIFGKRSCWIAQSNIWESVMADIASQLCEIAPDFKVLTQPICFKKGKFMGCQVPGTIQERIQGTDGDMPPCPLYIKYHTQGAIDVSLLSKNPNWIPPFSKTNESRIAYWSTKSDRSKQMLQDDAKRFSRLWQLEVLN